MDNKWDTNFFAKRKHIAWRAKPVCDQIIQQFHPKSVIDVGCGIGEFLKDFQDRGIVSSGVELTDAVYPYLMIPKENVILHNITKSHLRFEDKCDIALCFMVVGRLPENTWNFVAKGLTFMADTVITVVENEWKWAKCMKKYGFYEDTMEATIFRQALRPLFNKTAMRSFQYTQIFKREDVHERS